jgi:hypothetical protein
MIAVLVIYMVCPHEMTALRILIGGGVAALNAMHSERVLE